MLLSRFWFVLVAFVLGAAVSGLFLAQSVYNRSVGRSLGEGLSADSQVVSWYLKDDARMRSAHLVKFAIDPEVIKNLSEASKSETKLSSNTRDALTRALKKVNETIPADQGFDAVFAIDQHGRVVGRLGYDQASGMEDFELGGYPVVADALHGYVRDDTLVWDRLYRVVARPVEAEAGQMPAGAVVGARIMDDRFARDLSARTGAAVAFYANGTRQSAGAPEGFAKSNLDQIMGDLEQVEADPDYKEKGRSGIREIGGSLGVQYTRLQGEAYALGAGFAVGRLTGQISSPMEFWSISDDKDKGSVNWIVVGLLVVAAFGLGIGLTLFEHTMPLRRFHDEALRLASGQSDHLQPSKFGGIYRKLAAELNDGIDKVASTQGGVSRKAADLEQVLGDLPAQPVMAAFAVPDFGPESATSPEQPRLPSPPKPRPMPPGAAREPAPVAVDPEADWPQVFQEYVAIKQQCGEPVDGLTYDKFRQTLLKNQEAIVQQHGASVVKFSVYVKDGKAKLKANPVR